MGQVTIYLDKTTETRMKESARSENISVSKWVAGIIREKTQTEWPEEILALAGTWKDEFPEPEALRAVSGKDIPREAI